MEIELEGHRTLDSVYTRGKYVANGSFGHVCRGVSRVDPNKIVAIKEIDRRKFDPRNIEILVKTVQRQIESNQKFRKTKCPFIVEFIEYFQTEDVVSFIFEFCEETLSTLIEPYSEPKFFSKREYILTKILYEMLLTLRVLQSMNMIHRDIKPQNILICGGMTKLGDFGFCRQINQNLTSGRGSLRTTAPEAHTSTTYNKCDIWSLGVTIHTLLYGIEPFQQKLRNIRQPDKFRDAIMSKQFLVEIHTQSHLSEILKKMIVIQQSQRSSVSELLQHPIFQINQIKSTSDWIRQWLIFSSILTFNNKQQQSTILAIIASLFTECKVSYQLYLTQGKEIQYFLYTFQILYIYIKMLSELNVFSNQIMFFINFINQHYNQSFIQGLINDLRTIRKSMANAFDKLYKYIISGHNITQKVIELRQLCSKQPNSQIKSVINTHYKDFVIFPSLNQIIDHTDKFKWALNNIIAIAFKEPLSVPKFFFKERPEYHDHISIF